MKSDGLLYFCCFNIDKQFCLLTEITTHTNTVMLVKTKRKEKNSCNNAIITLQCYHQLHYLLQANICGHKIKRVGIFQIKINNTFAMHFQL